VPPAQPAGRGHDGARRFLRGQVEARIPGVVAVVVNRTGASHFGLRKQNGERTWR
jgi:hypothetical protein